MVEIYKTVVSTVVKLAKERETTDPVNFNVKEMPAEGLAKLRYVGAWAIRKVLNNEKKYVRDNIASSVAHTQQLVEMSYARCNLLEEFVVANFSVLEKTSKYPESLSVTEDRQYRRRGLIHIEDAAFEFFIEAESLRVQHLNENKMKQLKEDVVDSALATLKDDKGLQTKREMCFPPNVNEGNKVMYYHIQFSLSKMDTIRITPAVCYREVSGLWRVSYSKMTEQIVHRDQHHVCALQECLKRVECIIGFNRKWKFPG